MVNSRKAIRMQVKSRKTLKKSHLLNTTNQIYKKNKMLMKKKRMLYATYGVILKQNIPHYRKMTWVIKSMKMKLLVRNMKTKMIPKVYQVF